MNNLQVLEKIRRIATEHNVMANSAGDVIALLRQVQEQPAPENWDAGAITLREWRSLDYEGKCSRIDDAEKTCTLFDSADFAFNGQRDGVWNYRTAVRVSESDTDHHWVVGDRDGALQRIHAWDLWQMDFTPMWVSEELSIPI